MTHLTIRIRRIRDCADVRVVLLEPEQKDRPLRPHDACVDERAEDEIWPDDIFGSMIAFSAI